VRFEKWQSLGNDYVIVELDELPWELTRERVKRLCEPHFGIGSDGILLLSRPEVAGPVAELRIFNPDGSEAELSGNGVRQAALYLRRAGWTGDDEFSILTKAGEVRPAITSPTTASVAMGRASLTSDSFPSGGPDGRGTLAAGGREWPFQHVWVGNPQCVIEAADEVEELDLGALGPQIEDHDLFPNRTNVSFVKLKGSRVRARIFERGVGETLSSGTGASGAAVTAVVEGARSPVVVQLDGGELTVEVEDHLAIRLTGAAHPLFAGEISAELVRELEEG
jgi:diaminopimelate epimerase